MVRQQNILLSLFQNYDQALKAQAIEADSAGLANQRYAIYLESVQAAINRQTDAWNKFVSVSTTSGTIKWFIDAGTAVLNFAAKVGGLPTLILTVATAFLLLKNQAMGVAFTQIGTAIGAIVPKILAAIAGTTSWNSVLIALKLTAITTGQALSLMLGAASLIATVVVAIANSVEKTDEKIARLNSEIEQTNANLERISQSKTKLPDLWNQFETLRNTTRLANDEQKKFIDIQNQIKTLIPEVNGSYDAQGNFIISNTSNLKILNAELQKQYDIELAIKNAKIAEGFSAKIDAMKSRVKDLRDSNNAVNQLTFEKNTPGASGIGGFTDEKALQESVIQQNLAKANYDKYTIDLKRDYQTLTDDQKRFYILDLQSRGNWGKELANQLLSIGDEVDRWAQEWNKTSSKPSTSTSGPIKSLTDLQKSLDDSMSSLASLNDQMNSLIDSYNKYGQLGLDQVSQLRKAFGDDYINAITLENGQIKLNIDALNKLVLAKAHDALASAEQALALDPLNKQLQKQFDLMVEYYMQLETGTVLSVQSIKDQQTAYQSLLKDTISMIKEEKDARKKAIQDTITARKDQTDAEKKALQDEADSAKNSLQSQLDGYTAIINAQKSLIDAKQKEQDYNQSISDKNKEISDIDAQLLALQFDNSSSSNAKRLELENQRSQKVKELNKTQNDYSVQNQKDALDKELKRFEDVNKAQQKGIDENLKLRLKSLDAEYLAFKAEKDAEIKQIDDYLSKSGNLQIDAISQLKTHYSSLYQSLILWNKDYGTSVQQDITDVWERAFQTMKSEIAELTTPHIAELTIAQRELISGQDLNGNGIIGLHSGGVAGGKSVSLNPSTEIAAKLLKTEIVTNESQAFNFINKSLPNLVAGASRMGGTGNISVPIEINVAGNLDKTVVHEIQESIAKTMVDIIQNRGIRRNAMSFSGG